jgi:hypothetical protein
MSLPFLVIVMRAVMGRSMGEDDDGEQPAVNSPQGFFDAMVGHQRCSPREPFGDGQGGPVAGGRMSLRRWTGVSGSILMPSM